jgi:hypothetical protein
MSHFIATALALTSLALAVAGCGETTGDRAASGGLLGAGAGVAVGAVVGAPLVGAALIGGAVGAVGGAATSANDVDLGRPVWR